MLFMLPYSQEWFSLYSIRKVIDAFFSNIFKKLASKNNTAKNIDSEDNMANELPCSRRTVITWFLAYRVIIIDDISYVKKTDAETHVLFEFIAHRYESGSLIITANHPFSSWDQIFPDSMMTIAAIDRLIHHATIIELERESYRKRQQLEQAKSNK